MKQHDSPPRSGHEESDAPGLKLLGYGLMLSLLCVGSAFLMWGLFVLLDARARAQDAVPHPLAQREEPPPGPRLQALPSRDLAEFRAAQQRALSSYAWIDKDAGIVRIPVDRALELVAESGLPHRPADAAPRSERKQ